jgi:hypothetical protein
LIESAKLSCLSAKIELIYKLVRVMGLIDHLICEYPLPVPEDLKGELSVEDWSNVEFQTQSFAHSYSIDAFSHSVTYTIESDGQIYKNNIEIEYTEGEDGSVDVKESDKGIERVDYTGEILFASLFKKEDYDHYLEFSALVWKGDLKELNFKSHEKQENTKRIEIEKRFKEVVNKVYSVKKTWYTPFINIYKKCVRFICSSIRFVFTLIIKLFWKIERLLT